MRESEDQEANNVGEVVERRPLGERVKLGWKEGTQSWRLIRDDPYLLILPGISLLFVTATWAALFFAAMQVTDGFYLGFALTAILSAYPSNLVGTFFGVAFVAIANDRLNGRKTSISEGLRIARTKLRSIAKWALLASGVGLLLQLLQHIKFDWIAAPIVGWLAGAAWTIVTAFVVPVLAFEDRDVRGTVRRSAQIVKERWGEGIGGIGNLSAVFLVAFLSLLIPGIVLIAIAFSAGDAAGNAVSAFLGLLFVASFGILTVAAQLLTLALYRYATAGVTVGFSVEVLDAAPRPRRLRRQRRNSQ
jgi:hypothetical protein